MTVVPVAMVAIKPAANIAAPPQSLVRFIRLPCHRPSLFSLDRNSPPSVAASSLTGRSRIAGTYRTNVTPHAPHLSTEVSRGIWARQAPA